MLAAVTLVRQLIMPLAPLFTGVQRFLLSGGASRFSQNQSVARAGVGGARAHAAGLCHRHDVCGAANLTSACAHNVARLACNQHNGQTLHSL